LPPCQYKIPTEKVVEQEKQNKQKTPLWCTGLIVNIAVGITYMYKDYVLWEQTFEYFN
jgi:hypothetical protein